MPTIGGTNPARETVARACVVSGDGLHTAMARQNASFTIEAHDANGDRQQSGGETFMVNIRGSSRVAAKVLDGEDGTYRVEYKASTSGNYSISVTLNGVSLPNSPFPLLVLTPMANPTRCLLKGDALHAATAREAAVFEVEFLDALGAPARAEELDVWVLRDPNGVSVSMEAERATGASADDAADAASPAPAPSLAPEIPGPGIENTSRKPVGMRPQRQLRAEALAHTGGRVEVGQKPLIMRANTKLDSPFVTVLRPGQLVTVIEQREIEDGTLRAHVAIVDEEEGSKAIAESWWAPHDPTNTAVLLANLTQAQTQSEEYATSFPSSRSLNSPTASTRARSSRPRAYPGGSGWVTLVKNGADLVAQRPRLNAGERQKHLSLWKSREATDRGLKAALTANSASKKADGAQVGPSLAHEITADPMGIGFAYGGIHPGTLHAAGKLVKVHSVRYSIGAAGSYKLHVGLRSQAVPLPGSPFDLIVSPSTAHAPSTFLPEGALPLKGVVGDEWACTCTLHASDKMGNRCISGGAPIAVEVDSTKVETKCTDNENGTYTLAWRGKVSGSYTTRVRIDGAHVSGSPTTIKMLSGPPDVIKCEISGDGLKTALAGQPTSAFITCKDQFENQLSADSLQGNPLRFGLALIPVGGEGRMTRDTVPSMPFDGSWIKHPENAGEAFEVQYTAKEAGDFDLHVWCDPDASDKRLWLTGSPFTVRVTGVRPSTTGSDVGDAEALRSGEGLEAGSELVLRPQLRDQFGNASSAVEGEFEVLLETPDGTHPLELKQLKGLGDYEVSYEVVHKGRHSCQFLLNGEHIRGSPVEFNVLPSAGVAHKSRTHAPTQATIIQQPCELLVEAIDKFGNRLDRGGARVEARASGPGVTACATEDRGDGTYLVSFTSAVVGDARVNVRLDSVEMEPIRVIFVAPSDSKKAPPAKKGASSGEEAAPAPAM